MVGVVTESVRDVIKVALVSNVNAGFNCANICHTRSSSFTYNRCRRQHRSRQLDLL